MFESLFPWLHPGATLVPAGDRAARACSDAQRRRRTCRRWRSRSSRRRRRAAEARLQGRRRSRPASSSRSVDRRHATRVGKLQPTDVIVAVDGKPTPTIATLRARLATLKPGEPSSSCAIHRGGKHHDACRVKTIAPQDEPARSSGSCPTRRATIKLPLKVAIDAGAIGGPSAGLAFTLEVMRAARPRRRPRTQGRRDRRDRAGRHGRPDRRRQAEDVRRARGAAWTSSSCPPGENAKDARKLRRAGSASSLCSSSRPGVARAGNAAAGAVETAVFRPFETAGNSSVFVCGNACFRGVCAYHRTSRAARIPRAKRTDEQAVHSQPAVTAISAGRACAPSPARRSARRSGSSPTGSSRRRRSRGSCRARLPSHAAA